MARKRPTHPDLFTPQPPPITEPESPPEPSPATPEIAAPVERRAVINRPPHLRQIYGVSCGMRAKEFFTMLKNAGVGAVLDTRRSPFYQNANFAHGADLPYLCEVHGLDYLHVLEFAPPVELREQFQRTFKDPKLADDRDPNAWTRYFEEYEHYLAETKSITGWFRAYAATCSHEKVAFLCACRHQHDCHRSYALGALQKYVEGISTEALYPENNVPSRSSPRRYLLHDFPKAGLCADPPKARR